MAEFNIDAFKFPTSVDKVVNQGDVLEFNINVLNIGLSKPKIYDMNKVEDKITIIDSEDNIYSINVKLVNLYEDVRSQTGEYIFVSRVNTENLKKGNIRVIGYTYDLRGEVVPIRQLHKVV